MEKEKVTEELVRQNGNQAAAVMADYASKGGGGGSTGGGVPKFSDFAVLEELTEEEVQLWEAANASSSNSIKGYKLNKKVLEKGFYLEPDEDSDGRYELVYPESIRELDDAGNILAIGTADNSFMAKSSSKWSINVPDSVSDDYFYRIIVEEQ